MRTRLLAVVVAAIASGAIWMAIIPPFEGTDELHFYNRARDYAAHPQRREALFYRLAAPIIRVLASTEEPAAPTYSPGFRYIGNAHGDVNRFIHERPVAHAEHLRTLVALRALVVLLSALTLVVIFRTAALTLADEDAALGVAGICMFIPQYSFMNAIFHPEVVTRLLSATFCYVVVARSTRRWSRTPAWIALLLLLALVPLADRQAFFLVPFAGLAMVMTELGWRRRAATALAFLLPGLIAMWFIIHYVEEGTPLRQWLVLLRHPLGVLIDADPARGSTPPELAYYVYEYVPKLFMGFWGWLGQPSILLPAWLYAAFGILGAAAAAGLGLRSARMLAPRAADVEDVASGRLLARRLLAAGIAIMLVPIIYAPVMEGLNLWYGRWLFAMLGPIAMGIWLGIDELWETIRRRPHLTSAVVAVCAVAAGAWWLSVAGDAFRAGVGSHYGDRVRLLATVRDMVIALALCAAAIELWSRLPAPGARSWGSPGVLTLGVAGALNLTLLLTFVRPLYAPMSATDYAASITSAVADDDLERAAKLYGTAAKSYPAAAELIALADRTPRVLLGGTPDEMFERLQNRIAQSKGLADRDLLTALAEILPSADWSRSPELHTAIADAARHPGLEEPATLARVFLDGRAADRNAVREVVEAGHGVLFGKALRHGELILEGSTKWRRAGGTEVTVYFRPESSWNSRRVWLHAYPVGTHAYLDIAPVGGRPHIVPDELSWTTFRLAPGAFELFFGVSVGNDLGPGELLGTVQ